MALLENKKVILGSSSPRRKELLSRLGIDFDIEIPTCSEELDDKLSIENALIDVAFRKAKSIKKDGVIITADTIVVLENEILTKPKDENHAFEILSKLSGKTHEVLTAVCVKNDKKIQTFCVTTKVFFYELSSCEILEYIKTKEPLDKAGAYGIQGLGGLFVKEIQGDFYSVIGLPIGKLYKYLKEI